MVQAFLTGRTHGRKRFALGGLAAFATISLLLHLAWQYISTLSISTAFVLSGGLLLGACTAFALTYRFSEAGFETVRFLMLAFSSETIGSSTEILSAEFKSIKESLNNTYPRTLQVTGIDYDAEHDNILVEFLVNNKYGVFKFDPSTIAVDISDESWINDFSIRSEGFDQYTKKRCRLCETRDHSISIAVYDSPSESAAGHRRTCCNCIESAIRGVEESDNDEVTAQILADRI